MPFLFDRLYKRLGTAYFALYLAFDVFTSAVICFATVGLFAMYEDMTKQEFIRLLIVTEAATMVALSYTSVKVLQVARPLLAWVRGDHDERGALEAWRTGISLPRDFVVCMGWHPFMIVALPVSAYATYELGLPWYSAAVIFAGASLAVAYAAILHFFSSELALRPVLRDIVKRLPPQFPTDRPGVPLRWKLLGALPIINVITGVVVSGLSTDGSTTLADLGVDVFIAVLVAFTISLELTLLVTKSVLGPVHELLRATERVKEGDLTTRVPVVSGDEMGRLAGSFNEMATGLQERESLREAFGSYVYPEVAERILAEGELLEGDEIEVTVLFVDIRGFTSFADSASAREAVSYLNDFFGLVVPIVMTHGGHANKFIGDGLLAVFGAPERRADHADRALDAAREIARRVEETYGARIEIGIGLNSGPVIVGSVGGGGRLEFTVIGDPVNVAARVEKMTRETGDVALMTEATRCILTRTHPELVPRGSIQLRGKADPVALYAPVLAERAPAAALGTAVRREDGDGGLVERVGDGVGAGTGDGAPAPSADGARARAGDSAPSRAATR